LKVPGRVGQAATYGAGCWATDTDDLAIATCTTGNGEYLMKTLLAREICHGAFSSDCAVTSLHKTFKQKFLDSPLLPRQQDLYAGALTLLYYPGQSSGEVMWSHTTQSFCVGYMATNQRVPKVRTPIHHFANLYLTRCVFIFAVCAFAAAHVQRPGAIVRRQWP